VIRVQKSFYLLFDMEGDSGRHCITERIATVYSEISLIVR
jgi:hypothetical protein